VATAGSGNVYVADTFNHRIHKYMCPWESEGGNMGQTLKFAGMMLLAFALMGALAVTAHAQADRCVASKLKAIGKKESGLLACQAKVAKTNDSSGLAACESNVMGKFSAAVAKAGTCAGDEMTCEGIADGCESTVAGAFTDSFPSKCEASKRKAAGKLAKGELGCYSKAAAKGIALDSGCISKATGKFSAALSKAGTCPDGGSPQSLVESNCVSGAVTTDSGGMVTDVCPATTTTTTSNTTTSTTTNTTTTTIGTNGTKCGDGSV